jgi:esterase/lipase superfamily enzyme
MADVSPTTFNIVITLFGLLLYAFAWRVTRDLPPAAKIFARLALALVAIIPLTLAFFFGASTPKTGQPAGSSPQSAEAPRSTAKPNPPVQRSTQAPTTPAPPPPVVATTPDTGAARGLPVPAATPAPAVSADYDVVPVFYGTDRGAKSFTTRVNYEFERARRLELGRALVTVPKLHEVPNIERPWVYRIPLTKVVIYQEAEDPKKHFTMQEVKSLPKDEYLRLVKERLATSSRFKDHAVVFVHGFNTTFDHAVYRAAQLSYDLQFDGAPFVYSWPSKGQFGLQDYGYDRGSAEQAEPYFKEFLQMVTRETGAKSVSIIAHSMGNLVVLPVLRDLKNAAPPGVQISQIILAAPDVDRDRFENLAAEIKGFAKGTTLYVASNDWALELSKRLAGSVARAGDVPAGGPLLIPGIDTIDVTATSTDMFGLHHSGYAEKTALLNDIQLIIQTGERPPENRVPILQKVTIDRGVYWRYPATR